MPFPGTLSGGNPIGQPREISEFLLYFNQNERYKMKKFSDDNWMRFYVTYKHAPFFD
jgi:hypothetical protein